MDHADSRGLLPHFIGPSRPPRSNIGDIGGCHISLSTVSPQPFHASAFPIRCECVTHGRYPCAGGDAGSALGVTCRAISQTRASSRANRRRSLVGRRQESAAVAAAVTQYAALSCWALVPRPHRIHRPAQVPDRFVALIRILTDYSSPAACQAW